MERLPKGVYSPELREQAIRLYESEKLTVPELSKRKRKFLPLSHNFLDCTIILQNLFCGMINATYKP